MLQKLRNGMFASTKSNWYFNKGYNSMETSDEEFDWNIYPLTDLLSNYDGLFGWMPIITMLGPDEEWDMKPNFQNDNDLFFEDGDPRKTVKFDYLAAEGQHRQDQLLRPASQASFGRVSHMSVASEDLFAAGKDDIVYEG